MFDVIVIGGGAAGMMAAIKAAEAGASVALLEKNEFCGRKIAVTGKGRCNITNTKKWPEFETHIHPKASFLKPAFMNFSNIRLIEYLNEIGLETIVTQGERVFPQSMRAMDVTKVLVSRLLDLGVTLMRCFEVFHIDKDDFGVFHVSGHKSDGRYMKTEVQYSKSLIVATGGLSYKATGSTGDGYHFAKYFGHTIVECFPSLTALMPQNYDLRLPGIDLENVGLSLYIDKDLVKLEQGDLSFTNEGIEGSIGYRVSRKAVMALNNGNSVTLSIDLKPALSLEKLEARINRELAAEGWNRTAMSDAKMRRLLAKLMPKDLVAPFLSSQNGLNINNLASRLKEWNFKIQSYAGYHRAVVTAGGVSLEEVVAKTMHSRLLKGLFFAGEVLNLDGDTGGYNLQIAFSTGALAGVNAAKFAASVEISKMSKYVL